MRRRPTLVSAFLIALVVASSSASAANPRLRQILPHGGQRGTEVKLTLLGANLADAEELMLYDRGLEVVSLTIPEDEQRKGRELDVVVRIAPDCALGSQRLRLRSATGLSELQLFSVGPLPVVEEKEPNTDFATPQTIPLEHTIHGQIATEDVDYFAIDCQQGERINIEVVGLRLGSSPGRGNNFFDPYVAILDERRFELAAMDDASLVWNDPILSFVPPADGRFFIQLRDVAYNGDNDSYYLMHVGRFPRPTGIFPLGGRPGDSVPVTFVGDPAGNFESVFAVPTGAGELAQVEAKNELGIAPTAHPFRVSPLENAFELEPNNSVDAASVAPAPGAWNGVLQSPGDVDFYRFTAKKGQVFEVNVLARRLRSAADTVMTIRNAKGDQLAQNDDNRQPDSFLRFAAPEDGNYLVEISDQLGGGGAEFGYRVEVVPVAPHVAATTVETRRYVQPQFVVPQGGAIGVQMAVDRQDVSGNVVLSAENLPAGVTVECPSEWHGEATIPVVLRAAADAPVGGTWATFPIVCGDPSKPESLVAGLMTQKILMVRGQNNDRIWEEQQDRLPVVVTKPTPFRVRLETPKTPIVQGGQMPLKVVIERDEGFKDLVRVVLVQNPPGCSSATATEIPIDQTSVDIPLNAAANAPVRMSSIAVRAISRPANRQRGQGGGGGGGGDRPRGGGQSWETCSNWVPVSVEGPYFKADFQQAVIQQGQDGKVLVKIEKLRDFDGEAEITLVGLPANMTAEPLKMTKDQQELTFAVKAAADTPLGQVKNILCQVRVPQGGESIPFTVGTGRLRVDPPSKDQPAVAASGSDKPVSRLEQLRREQAAREAAQSAGDGTPDAEK